MAGGCAHPGRARCEAWEEDLARAIKFREEPLPPIEITPDPHRATEIVLTIDVEFTINGAFTDPVRCKPMGPEFLLGDDGSKQHGLGFILDTLARHKAKATFFVEALNTAYFGMAPMGAIARRIHEAGHDVQLHIHPCWTTFDHGPFVRKPGSPPPNDDCERIPVDELVALMRRAIDVFTFWGLPRPIALRTGKFSTSRSVYAAQRIAGLPIASNVCAAIEPSADKSLHMHAGRHVIEETVEMPVLSFVDVPLRGADGLRPLQITAVSQAEIRLVLDRARERGLDPVVALTHATEFFKRRNGKVRADLVNQQRLAALCAHVHAHPEAFTWSTFGDMARSGRAADLTASRTINGSSLLASLRMAQNALNDRSWWF